MKVIIRKSIAMLLAVVMIISVLPVSASANDGAEEAEPVETLLPEEVIPEEESTPGAEIASESDALPVWEEEAEPALEADDVMQQGLCGDDLTWSIDDDGTLTITGTGAMANHTEYTLLWHDYQNMIKHVIVETGATSIGVEAFSGCRNLETIVIPESVTSIGAWAFYNCRSLKSIILPNGLTDIGDNTFYFCTALESITIPEGVTDIGENAFWRCTSLKSVSVPLTLNNVGECAFYLCDNLTDVYYNGTRDQAADIQIGMENSSFALAAWHHLRHGSCGENLTWSIDENGKLTVFGTGAMDDYSVDYRAPWLEFADELKAAEIGAGITSIGNSAFAFCSFLKSIELPEGMTVIGERAFESCGDLADITIPEGVTSIGNSAFAFCSSLKSIELPEGMTVIGADTFLGGNSLETVMLPASVTSIGECAFDLCPKLSRVIYSGTQLQKTEIVIGDDNAPLTNAEWICAQNGSCGEELSWTFTLDGTLTITGRGAMEDYSSETSAPWHDFADEVMTVEIGGGVTTISNLAFLDCLNLTAISIPNGIQSIGFSAFFGCASLESIKLPTSLETVGAGAFVMCNSLRSIEIPDGVTDIGGNIFGGCINLAEIKLPASLETIGEGAFSFCPIESITIPDGVTSIGKDAFDKCSKLTDVYFLGSRQQADSIVIADGNDALRKAAWHYSVHAGTCGENLAWTFAADGTLTVTGTGAMEDYVSESSVPWYDLWNDITKVVIGEGVTTIGNYAFAEYPNLAEIELPASVTTIDLSAFLTCSALTDVYYNGSEQQKASIAISEGNDSLTEAQWHYTLTGACGESVVWTLDPDTGTLTVSGTGAMQDYDSEGETGAAPWSAYCDSIKKIIVEPGVTSIGSEAFAGCSKLLSVEIPDGVKAIGRAAFAQCSALTVVTLPDGVETVGERAFDSCRNLRTLVLPESVASIGAYAFCCCQNLKNITLPSGLKILGSMAFSDSRSIQEIKIPEGIDAIEDGTFQNCTGLQTVRLSPGVKTVCKQAFEGCSKLTDVYFYGTKTQISAIRIAEDNEPFTDAAWHYERSGRVGQLKWTLTAEGVLTISGSGAMINFPYESVWYDFADEIQSVVVEKGVTTVGDYAFFHFGKITDVTISEGVTYIGRYAFYDCPSLVNISLPKGLTEISEFAFGNCGKLTTIVIPEGVVFIDRSVFFLTEKLVSITLPESLTEVGWYAFSSCARLRDVYYDGAEWQKARISIDPGNDPLLAATWHYGVDGTCGDDLAWTLRLDGTLVIRGTGSIQDFSTDNPAPWYDYRDKITNVILEDGVESIGAYAFRSCALMESIDIPASVTEIADTAFEGCSMLKNVRYFGGAEISFAGQYYLMKEGTSAKLEPDFRPALLRSFVRISADENYPGVIAVDSDGTVHALAKGTAYVDAVIMLGNAEYAARCRVDVVGAETTPADEVEDAFLYLTSVSTELYQQSYTRIPVVLSLQNLWNRVLFLGMPQVKNMAPAITHAEFADETVRSLFDLRVIDDRTLEIVPTAEAIAATGLKSSYKSAVRIFVGSREFTAKDAKGLDTVLTVQVKKTMPNLKAAAIKFNSVLPNYEQTISFTGGRVLSLVPDETAAAKAKKPAIPEGFEMNGTSVTRTGEVTGSGKLYLLATVEGYAKAKPITVSYSVAATYPKITFSEKTLTIKGGGLPVRTVMKIDPAAFEEFKPVFVKVVEGKNVYTDMSDLTQFVDLKIEQIDNELRVYTKNKDGLAHTYKVYYGLFGKEYFFTVKVLPDTARATISAKQSGYIDTAVPNSPITLQVKGKNVMLNNGELYDVQILKYKAATRTTPEVSEDVSELFDLHGNGSVITLREISAGSLEKGYTYKAVIYAQVGAGELASTTVKLNIKWSNPDRVKASASLKVKGSIDLIRPGKTVTVTPAFKNYFGEGMAHSTLLIYEGKMNITSRFKVTANEKEFTVTLRDGETLDASQKHSVRLRLVDNEIGVDYTSTAASMSVTKKAVKVKAQPASAPLFAIDRFSTAEIRLTTSEADVARISKVTLDAASAKLFELRYLGNGRVELSYLNDTLPSGVKMGTTKTVKLSVFFNDLNTASATVSVKVTVK